MKTMKKIVAILAVAMLLCSMLPLSVMAADGDVTIKVVGTNGSLASDKSSISWASGDYSVVNYKASSTTAIRNSDSAHYRVYVGSKLTISGGAMSQVVIKCVSSYLINNTSNKVNAGWSVAANGTTITYTATSGSAEELTITIGKQSRITEVVITPYVASNPECDHSQFTCGDICDVCGEEFVHAFDNNCDNECNNCSGANPNFADHVYDGAYDAACNVCGAVREVNFPAADSVLSIPEANAIGLAMSHDTTTPGKYYVTGIVDSIANTTYGNLYIVDDEGNKLYVYGTYDATGEKRFDAMSVKPEVGMEITVYGVIGNYSKAAQMKNAWVTNMVINCEHEQEFECSKACKHCGVELWPDAVCVTDADYPCEAGACNHCGNEIAALDHAFDDEWDADCNYGCGYTREVEEKPELTEATLDFSSTTQRTEYTTSIQVWENGGLNLTNNKASSTSNVGNYFNPARFYKSSEIIISFPGMTSLVIDASNTGDAKYSTPWGDMLTAAGLTYTVAEKVYTITFAEPVDSITLSCSAQVRANSITATAAKQSGGDECTHQWSEATCTAPATCALCGATNGAALGHEWEIISQEDATCTASGSIVYECAACGEDKSETSPALPHTFEDGKCSACGFVKPVVIDAPKAGVAYKFGMIQGKVSDTDVYYLKGGMDGYYMATGTDVAAAIDVYLEETAGGYYMYTMVDGAKTYINMVVSGTHVNGAYAADASTVYTFNADSKTVIAIVNDAEYWFGTRNDKTFTTVGPVKTEYNGFYCQFYGTPCAHEYDNACDVDCNLCAETREVEHSVKHVDAKAATCAENGNIEYWFCDVCGMAWLNAECTLNTNLRAVVLPATGEHTYFDACSAICEVCGYEREVSHNVIHVEAKTATCAENGNIEYWYCDVCGMAWLNAECTLNTNLRAVVLPATGEHTYDDEYDADCNVCGDEREVPEKPVGDTIYGDADGDGEITATDSALLDQYLAGWDVTLNEVTADADGDGEITATDSALLLQHLAGWDVTLGPVEPEEPEQGPLFNDGELSVWPQP